MGVVCRNWIEFSSNTIQLAFGIQPKPIWQATDTAERLDNGILGRQQQTEVERRREKKWSAVPSLIVSSLLTHTLHCTCTRQLHLRPVLQQKTTACYTFGGIAKDNTWIQIRQEIQPQIPIEIFPDLMNRFMEATQKLLWMGCQHHYEGCVWLPVECCFVQMPWWLCLCVSRSMTVRHLCLLCLIVGLGPWHTVLFPNASVSLAIV